MTATNDATSGNLIPTNPIEAGERLARLSGPTCRVSEVPNDEFLRGWNALFYLHPGLHPDGFDDPESGWPEELLFIAGEAWRRFDVGEIGDSDIYCADAGWAGLCDGFDLPTLEEAERRRQIALIK